MARMADWRGDSVSSDSSYDASYDSSTAQLADLDIDLAGGELTVEFGDVEAAQLDADTPRTQRVDVRARRGLSARRLAVRSFVDAGRGSRATLILPGDLDGAGIRADIQVTGGALEMTGDFGDVTVEVAGGTASVDGAARDVRPHGVGRVRLGADPGCRDAYVRGRRGRADGDA